MNKEIPTKLLENLYVNNLINLNNILENLIKNYDKTLVKLLIKDSCFTHIEEKNIMLIIKKNWSDIFEYLLINKKIKKKHYLYIWNVLFTYIHAYKKFIVIFFNNINIVNTNIILDEHTFIYISKCKSVIISIIECIIRNSIETSIINNINKIINFKNNISFIYCLLINNNYFDYFDYIKKYITHNDKYNILCYNGYISYSNKLSNTIYNETNKSNIDYIFDLVTYATGIKNNINEFYNIIKNLFINFSTKHDMLVNDTIIDCIVNTLQYNNKNETFDIILQIFTLLLNKCIEDDDYLFIEQLRNTIFKCSRHILLNDKFYDLFIKYDVYNKSNPIVIIKDILNNKEIYEQHKTLKHFYNEKYINLVFNNCLYISNIKSIFEILNIDISPLSSYHLKFYNIIQLKNKIPPLPTNYNSRYINSPYMNLLSNESKYNCENIDFLLTYYKEKIYILLLVNSIYINNTNLFNYLLNKIELRKSTIKDIKKSNILKLVCSYGNIDMLNFYISNNVSFKNCVLARVAIENKNNDILDKLIKLGCNINNNKSLYKICIKYRNIKAIDILYNNNYKEDICDLQMDYRYPISIEDFKIIYKIYNTNNFNNNIINNCILYNNNILEYCLTNNINFNLLLLLNNTDIYKDLVFNYSDKLFYYKDFRNHSTLTQYYTNKYMSDVIEKYKLFNCCMINDINNIIFNILMNTL